MDSNGIKSSCRVHAHFPKSTERARGEKSTETQVKAQKKKTTTLKHVQQTHKAASRPFWTIFYNTCHNSFIVILSVILGGIQFPSLQHLSWIPRLLKKKERNENTSSITHQVHSGSLFFFYTASFPLYSQLGLKFRGSFSHPFGYGSIKAAKLTLLFN